MKHNGFPQYSRTMTKAQQEATRKVIDEIVGENRHQGGRADGLTVFMYPTTRPPTYIEVRYYDISGKLLQQRQAWP